MMGAVAAIIGGGMANSYGASHGTVASVEALIQWYWMLFVPLTAAGLVADWMKNKEQSRQLQLRKQSLHDIARKYNAVVDMLQDSYREEKRLTGRHGKEALRRSYEEKYRQNAKAFHAERSHFLSSQNKDTGKSRLFKKYWKALITIGLVCQVAACSYTAGTITALEPESQEPAERLTQTQEAFQWNARNIPMPHLTDGSRYVSNPDGVVSAHTEEVLNRWLKRMDDSLQIESAMVIVNRVENGDPFRLAQDLFDRYQIGKNDRGLVVVLAYEDHRVRTHTGRSLEADLTDIECSRLQETYAVPYMKAEQPDSGMLYLTEAIYNTLKKKELPVTQYQRTATDIETVEGFIFLYMLMFAVWAFLIIYLCYRYVGTTGSRLLKANPFVKAAPVVIVSGGGGRSGGFGGGGGFSGGFSGGSSGGGGATSGW